MTNLRVGVTKRGHRAMVRRAKKQARAGAWREFWFEGERAPTWVRVSGAKEKRMNPWSALLNGGMLAQGRSGGNAEGQFGQAGPFPPGTSARFWKEERLTLG